MFWLKKPQPIQLAPIQIGMTVMEEDEEEEQTTTSCAWCNAAAGQPQGNGSHGICLFHAQQMLQAAKTRRRQDRVSTERKSAGTG